MNPGVLLNIGNPKKDTMNHNPEKKFKTESHHGLDFLLGKL